MDKREQAVENRHNRNNCCQAVIMAYAEELGMRQDAAKQLGAAFGGGMGTMDGICGALAGAGMVLGLKKDSGKPVMRDAAQLINRFKEKCSGVYLCKDLKGRDTGVVICSCDDCVRNAVDCLEEVL
ncbi:MAG: C_GCAxxG_C_C family protein [Lachnospiraceae bacterium]|nr:C_GCAxxG_C_C family protein [Lachnospiraceae bacterium]